MNGQWKNSAASLLLLGSLVVLVLGLCVDGSYSSSVTTLRFYRPDHLWTRMTPREEANALTNKDAIFTEVLVSMKRSEEQRELLEELFWDVSTPSSNNYGRHLTTEQITDIVGAREEDLNLVVNWLESNGATNIEVTVNEDYVIANMKISDIERAFEVEFGAFQSKRNEKFVFRSTQAEYHVPSAIAEVIEFVMGVSDYPVIPTTSPSRSSSSSGYPGINITPPMIKEQYNITTVGQSPKSSQGLAEFEQEFFYVSDLLIFEDTWNLPHVDLKLVGPDHPNTGDLGEASLDVQYIIGVSNNVTTWVFYKSAFDLVGWGLNVSSYPNAPKVHSISYGSAESDYDVSLMDATNIEFKKLGLLGMSIFVASGDYGTGHTGIAWCGQFTPMFPASSPYITSVGATYINRPGGEETAVSFSGGGFSNTFGRPSYQDKVVSAYLNGGHSLPDEKYWNASGRGIPDVSALGTNFQVIVQNFTGPISGTSAASPTFAAIISLVNDQRYLMGKSSLGFLNPLFYQLEFVGYDITEGNNKAEFCPSGFPATTGWDAITGLGTPSMTYLLKNLLDV